MGDDGAPSRQASLPTGGPVQIVELPRRRAEILRFLKVSYGIYAEDPRWVAPLLMDLRQVFSDANPFLQHAELRLWVAVRQGRDVGRVAGILDHNYNRIHPGPVAFFGFFESVPDRAVSQALFDRATAWARGHGSRQLIGPMNPSSNDECGLLVEGYDTPPVFMMPYNPRYYAELVEAAGYRKAKDLLAFYINVPQAPMDRLGRIAARVRQRDPALRFRPIRRRTLPADLGRLKEVYNQAWSDNWGFVPMTDGEIDFLAGRLKPLFYEGLVWLAEAGDVPVGFLLALPDYNPALQPLRGRLIHPRLPGALPALMGWRLPARCRVLTLGVVPAYRGRGLESVMLYESLQIGLRGGIREAEASWILEDNVPMRRVLEVFGARPYKTYRLYERDVD